MNQQESPVIITCEGSPQVGIFHKPEGPVKTGVVMVVAGGPQCRVGRSRQMITWARRMANAGYAVLRFDFRGLGDSAGGFLGFEAVDADIKSAIDALQIEYPKIEHIILWGECNSASSIMMYAWQDLRVTGMIIRDPWVRDKSTQAKTYIKHYYLQRLQEKSFWLKIFKGQFNIWKSFISLLTLWQRSKQPKLAEQMPTINYHSLPTYQEKMLEGFSRFTGNTLLFMNGSSLTGKEFEVLVASSGRWQKAMATNTIARIDDQIRKSDNFSIKAYSKRIVEDALRWMNNMGI